MLPLLPQYCRKMGHYCRMLPLALSRNPEFMRSHEWQCCRLLWSFLTISTLLRILGLRLRVRQRNKFADVRSSSSFRSDQKVNVQGRLTPYPVTLPRQHPQGAAG
jgi:hypothetical protein